jgi:hypothetical protein
MFINERCRAFSDGIFILVDAYDEFKNTENESRERAKLWECLQQLCLTEKTKLFITTRYHFREDLQNCFIGAQITVIKGDLDDVTKYLTKRMEHMTLLPTLKKKIAAKILKRTQIWGRNLVKSFNTFNLNRDSFLLVILQANYVLGSQNTSVINQRLGDLPMTPKRAYRTVIGQMRSEEKIFAWQILAWIFHARRVLTMVELQEALVIKIGQRSLDHDNISSRQDIERACGGLVEYNDITGLVTFSHECGITPFTASTMDAECATFG